MIHTYRATITTSGADGSATGSGRIGPICGRVLAVHLGYSGDQAATTNVALAEKPAPTQPILTVSDNATDGWYYPRATLHDITGVGLLSVEGGAPLVDALPVDGYIDVTVDDADDGESVTVIIRVEQVV